MFKKTTLLLAALLCFASLSTAQTEMLRGKVENGEGTCYYCPGFDFVIDCHGMPITSAAYDLNLFIGQQIEAVGFFTGVVGASAFEITSLTVVTESFSIGGGGSIGGNIKFTAMGTPGDVAINLGAFGVDVNLVGPSGDLVYLLDPVSAVLLQVGTLDSTGELGMTFSIPNDPSLDGLNLYGQSVIVPQSGASIYLSNVDCKTIKL